MAILGHESADMTLTYARVSDPTVLRNRWHVEAELIDDARERGWDPEVERHSATQRRIERLLADLDEPLEGPRSDCQPLRRVARSRPQECVQVTTRCASGM